MVFGARAGYRMRDELRAQASAHKPSRVASNGPVSPPVDDVIREIQDVMWRDAGIVRTGTGLKRALEKLQGIRTRVAHPQTRRAHEARNLQALGMLVARSALAREESRGAHYRLDFPAHNDAKFLKHSVIKDDLIRFA